jgi:hypothetical protein
MHLIDQQLNLMIRGQVDAAWKISEQLQRETPHDLRHQFNRGWFLLNQGKFQEGFQLLEAGRFLNTYGGRQLPTKKPIWDGSDLTNKKVIINLEGGFGDCMIFARFAKEIKKRGGTCIFVGAPELKSLFLRIEGVSDYITTNDVSHVPHDFWIPSFSCSWLFGHDKDTLPNMPYLSAYGPSVEIWKNIIQSKKLKVGIRWSGSPTFEHQQFRIFPPEPLIALRKYTDIQLYSFQRDNDIRELPDDVVDLQHLLLSWEDTAAAIENLDLMITSCTSIAHLSAAMGKRTWIIVPILPYHVWAYGGDHSPWYQRSTKIYRQTTFGNWDAPFAKIEQDLVTQFNVKK